MAALGWVCLIIALACGVVWSAGIWLPAVGAVAQGFVGEASFYGAAPLQALGVFAMRRAGRRGWPVIVGALAVLFWLVALGVAGASVGMGPGAGVYGILIMLPAIGIATLLQLVALIGFAQRAPA